LQRILDTSRQLGPWQRRLQSKVNPQMWTIQWQISNY
jgi:hypothetical protein